MPQNEMRKIMEFMNQEPAEILKPGTEVRIPHQGKMVVGKIVRLDRRPGYTDAYVVYIGKNASETVPVHRVQVQEAGGIIDKTMAALGSKAAKGRVAVGKEKKDILAGWKEFAAAQEYKNDDVEGFKDFLVYWNFNSEEIDKIVTEPFKIKDSLKIAAKLQHRSGKGVTGAERGGPFKQKPTGDDYKSIIKFYTSELKGNAASLQAEFASVKSIDQISGDPLAALGYAFMKANGKG